MTSPHLVSSTFPSLLPSFLSSSLLPPVSPSLPPLFLYFFFISYLPPSFPSLISPYLFPFLHPSLPSSFFPSFILQSLSFILLSFLSLSLPCSPLQSLLFPFLVPFTFPLLTNSYFVPPTFPAHSWDVAPLLSQLLSRCRTNVDLYSFTDSPVVASWMAVYSLCHCPRLPYGLLWNYGFDSDSTPSPFHDDAGLW